MGPSGRVSAIEDLQITIGKRPELFQNNRKIYAS